MTEAEWLTSSDVEAMLHCLWSRFPEMAWTDRKPQLLIYAFMVGVLNQVPQEHHALFCLIEKAADATVSSEELQAAFDAADRIGSESQLIFAVGYHDLGLACHQAARVLDTSIATDGTEAFVDACVNEHRRQAACIRDIFGNPFCPIPFDSSLMSPNIVKRARAIYDGHAFELMPQLADALATVGCEDPTILNHCRSQSPHVRGCWVLDQILRMV